MEIRLNTDFGSIRCTLRKMDPNTAFICDVNNIAFGHIVFENYKLIYKGVDTCEWINKYKLIKNEN